MENNNFEFKPLPPLPGQEEAQQEAAPEGPVPAGFNERFVAYLIDGLPFVLLTYATLNIAVKAGILAYTTGNEWLWKFLWMGLYVIYEAVFSSGGRVTLGKWLLNIRVRAADGGNLSFGKALVRALAYFLSSATLNIGYLMALFTKDKRALHDFAAGSRVVSIKERGDLGDGLVLALSWGMMVILFGTYLNNTLLKLSPSEKKQIIAAHRTISKLGTLELLYMRQNGQYTHELAKLADLTGNVNAVRAELFKTLEPNTLVIASNGRKFRIAAKARNWRHTEVQVLSKVDAPKSGELLP
ncbi:MAG: RDD family protein [Elusimicrobiales bacterium]|nr:RDD family protein [Elusimicrobiales bacterium]